MQYLVSVIDDKGDPGSTERRSAISDHEEWARVVASPIRGYRGAESRYAREHVDQHCDACREHAGGVDERFRRSLGPGYAHRSRR